LRLIRYVAVTVAFVVAAAALALPSAAWADTSQVNALGCYLAGRQVERPAGTEIVVRQGWAATTRAT